MSPGVLLRRAEPRDVPALAALERASFSHPWSDSQVAEEVARREDGLVLVLEGKPRPGDPLGGMRAYGAFRLVLDELHVLNVAVAPDWRRRGLARRLMGHALRMGARAGARRALLEVRAGNRAALELYEGLGFARSGRRREYYREPVEDAVLLTREGLCASPPDP